MGDGESLFSLGNMEKIDSNAGRRQKELAPVTWDYVLLELVYV